NCRRGAGATIFARRMGARGRRGRLRLYEGGARSAFTGAGDATENLTISRASLVRRFRLTIPPARRKNPATIFVVSVTLPSSRSTEEMAYVIAEPCIGTKDTACVDACPVDCIHPKKDSDKYATEEMLYIDPVECIDCGACVPVCPVSAIFALDDLPEKWKEYTERNAKYFGR